MTHTSNLNLTYSSNKWGVRQSGFINMDQETEMIKWCSITFGEFSDNWKASQIGFHRTFWFTRKEDAILFMLRWA